MTKRQRHIIGLRIFKTALAVTLSILLVRLFVTNTLTEFYAAFGAAIAMETTFYKSLRQALTQLIGVLAGTVVGYLSALLFPTFTPAWIAGLGVLILLVLSRIFKLSFSASLSCIIFLSACLMPPENILRDSLFRLRDTAVGIGVALVINALIRPYNNKKRILSVLAQLRAMMPPLLHERVVREHVPDLSGIIPLLRQLDREMELYHSQRYFHRKHDDEALLLGCKQLVERMVEELEAICGMDSPGDLAMENAARMQELGMDLPEAGISGRKCTRHDTIVMNYHLDKLLAAYRYLGELMEEA